MRQSARRTLIAASQALQADVQRRAAVGLAVTLRWTSSRRPWTMKIETYSALKASVGTVNSWAAQSWGRCLARSVRHVSLGVRDGPRHR
jgi:hypothetical protein